MSEKKTRTKTKHREKEEVQIKKELHGRVEESKPPYPAEGFTRKGIELFERQLHNWKFLFAHFVPVAFTQLAAKGFIQ